MPLLNTTKFVIAVFVTVLLAACGGGGAASVGGADTSAPLLTGLTSTPSGRSAIVMTATGTDNVAISAYCFQATSDSPNSGDACFQPSNQKTIQLSTPQNAYYVWARDEAGNVSAAPRVGPCSSAGFAASYASALPAVCMMTSKGEMVFALENGKAPITTANFLRYVGDAFYSDTVFHRIISTFMVQGGGFSYTASTNQFTLKAPTFAAIALEAPSATTLSNTAGTIAMARTNVLNSAIPQFFVNVVDNRSLDTSGGGYAVFGHLISGNETLNALKAVPVVSNGSETSLPTTPPVIQWIIPLK